jgi:signal transduction histidine kinase
LKQLAQDRVSTWTAVAEQAGVTLSLTGSEAGALWAECVPGGVEQILDNLLSNAIEASAVGSAVEVDLAAGAEHHQLSVIDHGPGLSAEDRRHALERFWRADSSAEGSGLGLAIVQSLVEASGGTVQLDAVEPTGLAARVHLRASDRKSHHH